MSNPPGVKAVAGGGSTLALLLPSSADIIGRSVAVSASNDPSEDRWSERHSVMCGMRVQSYGVFDGHGGTLAVEIAADALLGMVFSKLSQLDGTALQDSSAITTLLNDSFSELDQEILAEAMRRQPGYSKNIESVAVVGLAARRAGCCVLVMLIIDHNMYFAHVGDCRAVLVRTKQSAPSASKSQTSSPAIPGAAAGIARVESGVPPAAIPSPSLLVVGASGAGAGAGEFTTRDLYLEYLVSTNTTMTTSKKKRKSPLAAIGGAAFAYSAYSLEVIGVTTDHATINPSEVLVVKHTTCDPSPIRPSEGDKDKGVKHAPVRVAGSLSVTRALGDGYLKSYMLSDIPRHFLPYITSKPTVTFKRIDAGVDLHVVLASDGLWNYMTAKDVHQSFREHALAEEGKGSGGPRPSTPGKAAGEEMAKAEVAVLGAPTSSLSLADVLLKRCTTNARLYCGKTTEEFDALRGREKRAIVDDITVLVVSCVFAELQAAGKECTLVGIV